VRSALGGQTVADGVRDALLALNDRGISAPAIALALQAAARVAAEVQLPDLVWSGPEVPGLHARDTRRVYEELVGSATRSLWISTYAYYDGPRSLEPSAPGGVLHAKAVIADEEVAFITSANLTPLTATSKRASCHATTPSPRAWRATSGR
jgi:phosphatidylserine/phosphatidylglycerophosphate/cardiolipin synthase-like enzyme